MEAVKKTKITQEALVASAHFTHANFQQDRKDVPITPRAQEILDKSNQLVPELTGLSSLDPFSQHGTSPRKQMAGTQTSQHLTILGSGPRTCISGMERRYGDETFKIEAPEDIEIIRLIERYPRKVGADTIPYNPQTLVLYEEVETRKVGVIELVDFLTQHQRFGFRYKDHPAMSKLSVGSFLAKGEVLRDSPAKGIKSKYHSNPGYNYGVELNVAAMTVPGVAEDGFIISESAAKKFSYYTYEHHAVEVNENNNPVMLYPGDRIFPDIGEEVLPNGLLMATRPFSLDTAIYSQSPHAMRKFAYGFDQPVFVPLGGRVVDIRVLHDPSNNQRRVLTGLDRQLLKYHHATVEFYKAILSEYYRLKKKRGGFVAMTERLSQLVVEAMKYTEDRSNAPSQFSYRASRIDDWRIEFVIEYYNEAGVGYKMADTNGGKATIVKVEKDENMPVDEMGNRADIICDPISTIARSIIGQVYEPKYTATLRDQVVRICNYLNLKEGQATPELLQAMDADGRAMYAFGMLLDVYKAISPDRGGALMEHAPVWEKYVHLANVINGKRMLFIPGDNEKESPDIVHDINRTCPNHIGKVSYVGNSGIRRTTVEDVLIGTRYMIGLDKTGMDYAAVNVPRLQHHGFLAQLSNANKHAWQVRQQAPRFTGGSELRILTSTCPPKPVVELSDRSSNRASMGSVVRSILTAVDPMQIEYCVDRNEVPLGNHRAIQIQRHSAECFGYRVKYTPFEPSWPVPHVIANEPLIYPAPNLERREEDL